MDSLNSTLSAISTVVWGPFILIPLLLGTGLWQSYLRRASREPAEPLSDADERRISALLRDNDGRPVPAPKQGGGQPVFLRLKQPDGKVFRETRLQPGAQGYFSFEQAIPTEAPTGRWQVEFRTDPASKEAVQGMTLRIEEFLPERMKLDLDAAQPVLKPGEALKLKATAAYLYGAPASGNRFTAKLAVAIEQHPLDQLPGYFFGDPTMELPKDAKDIIDTTLPENGVLQEDIALPAEAKPRSPIAACAGSAPRGRM